MTKKGFVYVFLLPLFLLNCGEKKLVCEICGEFEIVSLSKNELNSTSHTNVSVRRNLIVDNCGGTDYYTIWLWDKEKPDSSWTENMEKTVVITQNNFLINADGTWSWILNTEENFVASAFYGEENYRINKTYKENGNWKYANQTGKIITLERKNKELNNQIFTQSQTNIEMVQNQTNNLTNTQTQDINSVRSFQIIKDQSTNNLTLRSVEDDEIINLDGIHTSSYSLTEGNILLSLAVKQPLKPIRLALKQN